MRFDSKPQSRFNFKLEGWRSRFLLLFLMGWFVVLIGRDIYLQGFHANFLKQKGQERYSRVIDIPANRGIIRDRNGVPLAISVPSESILASRENVDIDDHQEKKLAGLLGMDVDELKQKLDEGKRNIVYLKRQVNPSVAQQIMHLDITGLFAQRGYHRAYPKGEEVAHVIGFTNSDDMGQEGIEFAYQRFLGGRDGAERVIKDRAGHIIEDEQNIRVSRPGQDITLSIDYRIQHLAYRELTRAVELHHAEAGSVIVVDSLTGEILALANCPNYDPNDRHHLSGAQLRNRALTDSYEPGSTLKPFTIATALELGKVTPDTVIPTTGGVMSIGPAKIHDTHRSDALTVAQVIQHSSNVGAARIALSLDKKDMWNTFTDVGFGLPPKLGFPGETGGKVRPYKTWRPIEQATMAYGNGISVSLTQLAQAYTVFANHGVLKPLSIIKVNGETVGRRVFSQKTADEVKSMLEMVVQPGGTAIEAQVKGYRVAGKTGTAHKVSGRHYGNHYIASFVGFAPASNPRYIIGVMIDDPKGAVYYGGEVAAPVFSVLMGSVLQMNAVPPDAPGSGDFHVITKNDAAEDT
ncbi:MAG: cell division protein [Ferrovum sp. 37-45-19]|nr:MAG: cell division protein [Ferrovum sp. 21-44-67]OYV95194.1 MAG: cell division protein [Ferrovum sp. 37-45-19]OZB33783.1 MAG: cell division protein [Ferrovum sp. 34-44-207]HQT80694.1 penicillin-binding protein 2 [Ferrovaceae bacterium]HQU05904.1 penicillin-binding protein 2 [Ferrovaceae bacterium]